VRCAACGTDNPPGTKFCGECAAPLARVCPSCGTPPAADQKFCRECAAPLTAAPTPVEPATPARVAERRVCTVLFADLVGFTPLSEARDAEEVRELLSRYFEVARTVIGRYGGTVEKFIGDAVMAVWGAPVAAESDAERAVRAALDLLEAVAALGVEVGIPTLAARAGLVTGEVAVTLGQVGEGMVAGDAVNTAARIQTAAEPGSALVDDATRRLAVAAVGFVDAGEHLLKGKSTPEHLWRATRVLAGTAGSQRVDGLEARLIGRDTEMRLIKELFHAAADRRTPRLMVVAGAAGVGKSRLGWEFRKYIDGLAQVIFWHRGRCLSYGEGVAFWALAEAIRQRLQIAEEDPTEVAATKLDAGLADLVPDPAQREYVAIRVGRLLGVPVAGDTGATLPREELFAGWRLFFERLAATDPVILVIEDGQHADAGLLDFLDHLVDWARDLPVFVLVFTRPELDSRRPGFGVGRNRTLLTLDPLDATSMDELVDALVPGMPATARAAITTQAQGVPLFAVETVRSLIDRDIVLPVEGVYRLVGDVGALSVPDSLHGLLAARLDALDPTVRSLVADAAVLGSSFPAEALIAVSGQDPDSVRTGLAELVRREVLEVFADPLSPQRGDYRFTQNLLRQVAYETMSRRDRKARHLAVAAHLRATFADDGEEVADVVARHYLDALAAVPEDADVLEIRAEAIALSGRAAERSSRQGAAVAASASYATAAELSEAVDPAEAAAWWARASDAAWLGGQWETSTERATRARELYLAAEQPRAAARAQALIGRSLRRAGRHTEAREQLEAALAVLRPEPGPDTVEALHQLATLEVFSGGADAFRATDEALGLGQALDVAAGLLADLLITAGIMHSVRRPAESIAYLREAVRIAERSGDTAAHGRALINLSDILAAVDPATGAATARSAIDQLRRVGARDQLAFATINLAEGLFTTGQWDEADAVLTEAITADGLDDHDYVLAHRAMLAGLRGDHAAARQLLDQVSRMRGSEDPQDLAMVSVCEAVAATAAGRPADALEHAQDALAHADVLGLPANSCRWAWPLAARAASALGEQGTVEKLLAMLDAAPIGQVPPILRAERDLARARLDPSASAFHGPIAALRRIPAPYHLAHGLLDQAPYVEPAAASANVQEVADIAARLDCRPLAERASQSDYSSGNTPVRS
jgi:class 3 adenylate cyclase/tetratricopeptide (TPR) repeat protein